MCDGGGENTSPPQSYTHKANASTRAHTHTHTHTHARKFKQTHTCVFAPTHQLTYTQARPDTRYTSQHVKRDVDIQMPSTHSISPHSTFCLSLTSVRLFNKGHPQRLEPLARLVNIGDHNANVTCTEKSRPSSARTNVQLAKGFFLDLMVHLWLNIRKGGEA